MKFSFLFTNDLTFPPPFFLVPYHTHSLTHSPPPIPPPQHFPPPTHIHTRNHSLPNTHSAGAGREPQGSVGHERDDPQHGGPAHPLPREPIHLQRLLQ